MKTAKLFRHGGSQAVRLPKPFRFEGSEVVIERRGSEVVLSPKPTPRLESLREVARFMREQFPAAASFPDRQQPGEQQLRNLDLD
ncbi:MAG TPA: AbrB/MazE/SpoVT family DNA-binding domain-containing protein [Thermoanaerobaculia bacterium]|nr:AbrB/MazE/SpoVT family DNA-binding domain-containing protein [Thermoanaerobaculia bacterium]